jgi:hypothetical protein
MNWFWKPRFSWAGLLAITMISSFLSAVHTIERITR